MISIVNTTAPSPNIEITLTLGAVVGIIIGTIFSILTSFISKYIYQLYNRPDIGLGDTLEENRYDGARTFITVFNNGPNAAHNCTGRISIDGVSSSLLSVSPGQASEPLREHTLEGHIEANLCWSVSDGVHQRTLNVEDKEYLGLFRVYSDGILIPSEHGWKNPTAVLHPDPKQYDDNIKITVYVTAENCQSVEKCYKLDIRKNTVDLIELD
jgi:hypothetical protein